MKSCQTFYLSVMFFFFFGVLFISLFFQFGGFKFAENLFMFLLGTHFSTSGVALLLVLAYYFITDSYRIYRKFNIEGITYTWISFVFLLVGVILRCGGNSPKLIITGSLLGFMFILPVIGCIHILKEEKEAYMKKRDQYSDITLEKLIHSVNNEFEYITGDN